MLNGNESQTIPESALIGQTNWRNDFTCESQERVRWECWRGGCQNSWRYCAKISDSGPPDFWQLKEGRHYSEWTDFDSQPKLSWRNDWVSYSSQTARGGAVRRGGKDRPKDARPEIEALTLNLAVQGEDLCVHLRRKEQKDRLGDWKVHKLQQIADFFGAPPEKRHRIQWVGALQRWEDETEVRN